MTYLIGLTGGIGSGKTVASNHFGELGVPIIDTDVIAREIVEPSQPALTELVASFGTDILQSSGELDRATLRERAFSSKEAKATLDQITHPAILAAAKSKISQLDSPYCIVVIPLLSKESAFFPMLDRVLTVTADREQKIKWVKARNNLSRAEVERIMDSQLRDKERKAFANDVIENTSTIEQVHQRVAALHQKYLELAAKIQ